MFFDYYPSQYPYDHNDFYRALAAQRARERREAEYHARLQEARRRQQLEEALRRNAYQNHLAREQRRRSMYPYFSGFDSDEEYSDSPSYAYSHPTFGLRQQPRSRDIYDDFRRQQMASADVKTRRKSSSSNRTPSPVSVHEHPESLANSHSVPISRSPASHETTRIPIRSSSPQPDIRDQAARKIQAFFRTNMPRHRSLKAISSVAEEFRTVVKNFTFPETLDFGEQADAMELLYTSRNAPIHLHEHTLLNFLSRLDSIDSHGDERVRNARKTLVKEIEGELGNLDAKKLAAWEARRASISASVASQEEVPLTESQSEPTSTAMEINTEKADEVDSSVSEPSQSQPAPEHTNEQPSAIQSSEERMETDKDYQDSTEAQDSNTVSSDPIPHPSTSSDLPSSDPIEEDVSGDSDMEIERDVSLETPEQCTDEDKIIPNKDEVVNHSGALLDDPSALNNNPETLGTSFSTMPIELCV